MGPTMGYLRSYQFLQIIKGHELGHGVGSVLISISLLFSFFLLGRWALPAPRPWISICGTTWTNKVSFFGRIGET